MSIGIKKVGGRRFAEGLYQALFSFALPAGMLFTKQNEKWAWSKVKFFGRPLQSLLLRYMAENVQVT